MNLYTVTHPCTNRARRILTSLIETNALRLRQTTAVLTYLLTYFVCWKTSNTPMTTVRAWEILTIRRTWRRTLCQIGRVRDRSKLHVRRTAELRRLWTYITSNYCRPFVMFPRFIARRSGEGIGRFAEFSREPVKSSAWTSLDERVATRSRVIKRRSMRPRPAGLGPGRGPRDGMGRPNTHIPPSEIPLTTITWT